MIVRNSQPLHQPDFVQGNNIAPSAGYTGTAGSGFGGAYGAVPTDPVRTTAKPALRLLIPPNQYFTDYILVGVAAAANNAGTLIDNLGLQKVVVHYEGSTFDIVRPTWQKLTDANGNERTYYGWWCWLKHNGTHGHARAYFEAIPLDATMQSRVTGPWQFSPQAVVHDLELEIAATPAQVVGVRYKTVAAAMIYAKTTGRQNIRATITEAGLYDLASGVGITETQGYFTIEASVPITIGKASYTTDTASTLRPQWDGVCLRGENITLSFEFASGLAHEQATNSESSTIRRHWFDGVTLLDPTGPGALIRKGPKLTITPANNFPWITECTIDGVHNGGVKASLHRGNTVVNCTGDVLSDAGCAIDTTASNCKSTVLRSYIDAMTVQYTGAGASASLSMTGTNAANSRVLTAKVNGASVGTKTILNTEAGFIASTDYEVSDVVTWLNTLTNWTATLIDDTRFAAGLGAPGQAYAFVDVDVKTAPVNFFTWLDVHADLYQSFNRTDNVICWGMNGFENDVTNIIIGGSNIRDYLFLNCAFDVDEEGEGIGVLQSQQSWISSHVVMAHLTMSNQRLTMRTDLSGSSKFNPDTYCLVANCTLERMGLNPADLDITLANNHLWGDALNVPPQATGTTLGGNKASMYVNAGIGNFTPQGELLTNLKAPVLKYDYQQNARGATAPAGALAS